MEKNLRLTQDTVKKRDDAESMDNDSTMSTSSNLEPFASDDLGIVEHVVPCDFGAWDFLLAYCTNYSFLFSGLVSVKQPD